MGRQSLNVFMGFRGACPPIAALIAVLSANSGAAVAQDAPQDEPALETLLVTAPRSGLPGPVSETHHTIDADEFEFFHPGSADNILRRLPSAHVPTNSRGEALVYLRSAGERQVAAFFDGALLNVPWDNRYDLGLLPAGVIGRVAVAAGALSPQYGVNALGAVVLSPLDFSHEPPEGALDLRGGTHGERAGQAWLGSGLGPVRLLAAGGGFRHSGLPLPAGADLPFHQPDDALRTNTGKSGANALFRAGITLGSTEIAASFLHADVSRGTAPESDRADARFWRYPDARTTMGILSARSGLGERGDIAGTVWVQNFGQTIDSYPDANYLVPEARQEDRDQTYGARSIVRHGWAHTEIAVSASVLVSSHDQTDLTLEGAGASPTKETQEYRQLAASFGLDADHAFNDRLTVELGAGADHSAYVDTGDKPPHDGFTKPVLRLGASWAFRAGPRLRAALGRKSRMPTMREMFGTALGRFLINPNLRPETITTAEIALEAERGPLDLSLILFGQDVMDTIDQRHVNGLRQRINLEGSTVLGLELAGMARLGGHWRLSGQLTAVRARRKTTSAGETDRLAERPGLLARLALGYERPAGFHAGAEAFYTGAAWSMDAKGDLAPLEDSIDLHLHASWPVRITDNHSAEFYLSVRNILDAAVFHQAGLPAPGRSLVGGLRLRL